jgi:DNA-binding transcriptional ArsR family regulator
MVDTAVNSASASGVTVRDADAIGRDSSTVKTRMSIAKMTIAKREGDEVTMCLPQEAAFSRRCRGDDAEAMPDIESPFASPRRAPRLHDADRRAFVMVLRAGDDYPDHMTDIFDVIADGTRRDILQLLLRRTTEGDAGTSVSHIVAELGISQPTVSKHLKVLREAELVSVREDGQRRFYSLAVEPLEVVDDWLVPFLMDAYGDDAPDIDYPGLPLPDGAAHAAEVVGRAAASARHVVTTALKRLGG